MRVYLNSKYFDGFLRSRDMNRPASVNSTNRTAYSNNKVLDYYIGLDRLFPAETVLFEKLSETIRNSRVLDIGIGGGRTTRHLLWLTDTYVGIDYVHQFIDEARSRYRTGEFLVADASDLTEFADEAFDFVLFSYNGIDALSHQERMKSLKEIYRVLSKGGTLMFSGHNLDYRHFDKPYWLINPEFNAGLIKNFFSYLFFLPRHLRMKRREIYDDEYAIVNDCDHRYSLLVYYTSIGAQIKRLAEIGYSGSTAYNHKGEPVTSDVDSLWIYYVARK